MSAKPTIYPSCHACPLESIECVRTFKALIMLYKLFHSVIDQIIKSLSIIFKSVMNYLSFNKH